MTIYENGMSDLSPTDQREKVRSRLRRSDRDRDPLNAWDFGEGEERGQGQERRGEERRKGGEAERLRGGEEERMRGGEEDMI